ncbi:MAG TPA: chromosomal replication initiator protein DnaA [Candidatus Cloacimonadota bacterium]|nr:chromosomal replication initiator protein DnaA [Candidatus Cloacimonadota bacterium]HQB41351.1 chromosomal replication initiator protein DnaA [Candidatus Cloacimonadota bacterium]
MDQDVWQVILDQLEKRINQQSFKTWFNETQLIDFDDNSMVIYVPTKLAADYLNKTYVNTITEIAEAEYDKSFSIKFTENYQPKEQNDLHSEAYKKHLEASKLNSKYNFTEFVVGKSNNFAHSASMAVAESPGTTYNPLFIYGESGMGKTHLMQAIGNFLVETNSKKNVFYITTEQFTNEMIEAIRSNKTQEFRNKYRKIDVLLVDDIHFLSKKEGSQEEFFHTFNALYENRKQVVMTSDRPPKDIPDLENRLVTRFEWGLLADLKSPDFETRIAILKKKSEAEHIQLADEVIEFIAENISDNVRKLEGSLIRLLAYSSYNDMNPDNIDIQIAKEILSDLLVERVKDISMDNIFQKVCNYYNITPSQMLDKTRKANIAFPRQIAMYLSNLLIPSISLKDIANYYKKNDHTTVLHAKRMIENKFKNDNDLRIEIEKLIKDIKG